MIPSISWKNVWRNKLRSLIVIVAFTVGIFGGIYSVAFAIGMVEQRVVAAISNEISHVQVHNEKYLENNELQYVINDYDTYLDSIRSIPEVVGVSSRLKIFAMASTAGNAAGAVVYGIDPEAEKQVTNLYNEIQPNGGTYFNGGKTPIVIGEKLAKNLKLTFYEITDETLARIDDKKIKKNIVPKLDSLKGNKYRIESELEKDLKKVLDKKEIEKYGYYLKKAFIEYKLRRKIIISFQDINGDLAEGAFRVVGVYKTGNGLFDGTSVFVKTSDLEALSGIKSNQTHEIAVLLNESKSTNKAVEVIQQFNPNLKVEGWKEIMPEVAVMADMMNLYLYMIMVVVLLALGFGIVNTMLMAVLERVKELGMLMAVGMNGRRVFSMIMLETIFLSMVGAIIGMIISYVAITLSAKEGIDMSAAWGEGFEAFGYSAHIYPVLKWDYFIKVTIMVIITGLVACIYPARKAIKLNPAEALRTD
ncbi:MAG: ABC transporter permease [Bacteroidales bacterium]|nr:ABC transporter permease [Bacteroidales bacterium]